MAENFLLKNKNKKITICIGRIFNIFHKNQKIPFFYPSMIAKYKKNKNINNKELNLRTGNSIRDFTNAEKIAEIIFKLSKKKVGGIFNIGSGKKLTLLKFIRKHINNKVEIKGIKGDMIVANVTKLKRLLIIYEKVFWKNKKLYYRAHRFKRKLVSSYFKISWCKVTGYA